MLLAEIREAAGAESFEAMGFENGRRTGGPSAAVSKRDD
jgi:hypothetical protein